MTRMKRRDFRSFVPLSRRMRRRSLMRRNEREFCFVDRLVDYIMIALLLHG
jgi:hypothetical protein